MNTNHYKAEDAALEKAGEDSDVENLDDEEFTPAPLPQLTNEPQGHPDSCLSLSLPLIRALHTQLPPAPDLVLSIGSGTGLVEALLDSLAADDQDRDPPTRKTPRHTAAALNLASVEIAPSPNRYHAAHRHHTVPGTWALDPAAGRAKAWVFVYPKQVALVQSYMASSFASGEKGAVEVVLYVGPRMDWDDFRGAFAPFAEDIEVWGEERMEEVGGRAWECVAVVRLRR
ncbi:hypothetical protein CORC01_09885 [Colletotrichum orchidophilum]|uniref:Methyltransferase n=1 Tax=Colletotrichum orchidophilum TaxID=1209926 RepID=A0A1G4B035_9PEZI|nr:uncharacterized protein CORC01_09885 [Colletotrichum orchidophilum]OHE94778.1 hypothetical protein CORC01_09885 [Colletotrichum orchidophilum]